MDSLIEKYIVNGAELNNYNGRNWQLYCDTAIDICPNIAVAYQHKAIPYIKLGNYASAFPLEDKAVEYAPVEFTAYRGFLKCIFTKDYKGAIIDFEKAQELSPNNYEMDHTYFFYEGLCNLELKNYPKAEENFKQDIFLQTGGDVKSSAIHFNTLMYIGILYYEMHDMIKAKDYLLKSLAAYKESPDANFYLAMIYKSENDNELMKKYLLIAKEAKTAGYSISEDNMSYAYYPHQITGYEIEQALGK
jgi:tetratricopeptide (TPR) repeat protein